MNIRKALAAVIASLTVACAWADTWTDPVTGITWTYTVYVGEASLGGGSSYSTAVPQSTTGAIAIPSSLGGCPVTGIGYSAFYGCSGITSVTIGSGVTSVGYDAFSGCSDSLYDTNSIPGVKLVDGWAVGNTGSLSGALNLTGIRGIGDGAFCGCDGLTSVTIPNSVTSIGDEAFWYCSGLTSVTIPNSVTSIGGNAFTECSGLTSMTIPNSVTSIGGNAFTGCSGLTSVTIPDSVTSIGDFVFCGCSGLTSFIVGDGNVNYKSVNGLLLSKDGKNLIAGVNGDVTIPDGVTDIGWWAFEGCSGLTSVTIPDSVTSIGDGAFNNCSGLTSFIVGDGNVNHKSVNGLLLSKDGKNLIAGVNGDVTIPDGVTSIGDGAFCGCDGLTSVTIPDSVTSIGVRAFTGCSGLVSISGGARNGNYQLVNGLLLTKDGKTLVQGVNGDVVIPDSVTSIGDYAFYGCSGLKSVTIPNSVTSIESIAFYDCSGLTNIVFEGNAPSVGSSTFSGVKSGCVVYVPRGSTGWGVEIPGMWNGLRIEYIEDMSPDIWTVTFDANGGSVSPVTRSVVDGSAVGVLPTPARSGYTFGGWYTAVNGGTEIASSAVVTGAVTYYAHWSAIPVPEPIWTIDSNGVLTGADLNGCTDIVIPDSVTSIGSSAFNGCRGLTSVTIPDSVTSIGDYAFYGCKGLTRVQITNLSNWCAFDFRREADNPLYYAHNLYIGGEKVTNLVIPEGVNIIEGFSFYGCSCLTNVVIPSSVTFIGPGAFAECSGLTSIVIPEGVETICEDIFDDCTELSSVTLPDSVKEEIGGWLFYGCHKLTEICVSPAHPLFMSIDGVLYDKKAEMIVACPPGKTSVTVPASVRAVQVQAFDDCGQLTNITFEGNAPVMATYEYDDGNWYLESENAPDMYDIRSDCIVYVNKGSTGWGVEIPGTWNGLRIEYVSETVPDIWTVTFDAQGGSLETTRPTIVTNGCVVGELPTATRESYDFVGWFTAVGGGEAVTAETIVTADVTYYAHWTLNVEPESTPEPVVVPELYDETEAIAGEVPATAASEYNGCLVDAKGNVVGSIQVKVGKPNAKTGLASVKATVVVGAAKKSLKADGGGKAAIAANGPTTMRLVGGESCVITLGAEGLSGTYGAYQIDGARNFFTSKDKAEQGAANALLGKWLGVVSILADAGNFTVTISAKGKAKVSGTLANGKKATGNAVSLVGEEWACVPVVLPKANISFALWLPLDGGEVVVNGLGDNVVAGRGGALKAGAAVRIDEDEFAAVTGIAALPYLPDGVSVEPKGTKWAVAGGAKAGKVAYRRGTQEVDEAKLGDNPSGLKLTYKAKDGSFKGSFKVYAEVRGKLKATTVSVSGIVLNGVGYGTATVKGKGSVPVTIE